MGTIIFDPVTLTLEFNLLFKTFNNAYNLTLEFDPFFENFNLAYNFWIVSGRALIFHMSIPCDKTF